MRLPGRPRRPPRPDPLAPGETVYWSSERGAWRTTAAQASGRYNWTYDPDAHAWTRGERAPSTATTREQAWAQRRDELLREQDRLLAEHNRLLGGTDSPIRGQSSRHRALSVLKEQFLATLRSTATGGGNASRRHVSTAWTMRTRPRPARRQRSPIAVGDGASKR